jgi:hypothetical protein
MSQQHTACYRKGNRLTEEHFKIRFLKTEVPSAIAHNLEQICLELQEATGRLTNARFPSHKSQYSNQKNFGKHVKVKTIYQFKYWCKNTYFISTFPSLPFPSTSSSATRTGALDQLQLRFLWSWLMAHFVLDLFFPSLCTAISVANIFPSYIHWIRLIQQSYYVKQILI